ncbi:conserved membrane protein of unknown function [Petrocella atlantisensis]|uniref:GGDEF domain-containing protein n=2 Tax=Petrocella atlantisensis TaxID=2173034 RepID=A0A3P7NWK6_9FIRM|nr:conserved membrane protein of unknown function [Petrocella atlantisensis]
MHLQDILTRGHNRMNVGFNNEISPITLRIKDAKKEKSYQYHCNSSSLLWFRLAIVLGVTLYLSFCIVDYFLFSTLLFDFLKIRLFIVLPVVILSFILTYWRDYPKYAQWINIFAIVVSSSGIIGMAIIGRQHPEISRSYAGLVPYFLYIYAFLRIRFVHGTIIGTSLYIIYTLVEWYILKTPFNIFIANTFYMGASNFAGILISYLLEYQGKNEYLLQEKLEKLTLTDAMTGLYNRYYYNNYSCKDIQRFLDGIKKGNIRERRSSNITPTNYGLVLLDIDHFKKINDTYGHDIGDSVLINLAELLKKQVCNSDDILRWGGEEFLIILKSIQNDDLGSFVRKIGSCIENLEFHLPDGTMIQTKCSIGCLSIPFGDVDNLDKLIKYTDDALYRSKKSGRNKGYQATFSKGTCKFIELMWH